LQTFSAGVAVVARLLYPAAGPALRLIRVVCAKKPCEKAPTSVDRSDRVNLLTEDRQIWTKSGAIEAL
jgi:hypothetical protein